MKEALLNLIRIYEEKIAYRERIETDDKKIKLHNLISIAVYKNVIQDLKMITDKFEHENNKR